MTDAHQRRNANSLEARYANYVKVGHNAVEFVFDFGQFYANEDQVQFHTRIATAPLYAKAFAQVLHDVLDTFETAYGVIEGSAEDTERDKLS